MLKGLELLQPLRYRATRNPFSPPAPCSSGSGAPSDSREHVALEVTEIASGITLQAKAGRQASQIPEVLTGRRIRLAYTPGINAYNGIASVELRVRDWELLPA